MWRNYSAFNTVKFPLHGCSCATVLHATRFHSQFHPFCNSMTFWWASAEAYSEMVLSKIWTINMTSLTSQINQIS